MAKGKRIKARERKKAILEAARPLFARNGFRGTSVREIARAAKVSEALLYKHFASKEEIHEEVMGYAGKVAETGIQKLQDLEAGTEALVARIYFLVRVILLEVPRLEDEQRWHERLLYRSLLGDNKYARTHFRRVQKLVERGMNECFEAAVEAGDLKALPIGALNRIWFVHHLAMALNLSHLAGEPAFAYEGSKEELVEQAVLFSLRGIGMTETAIARTFQPARLVGMFERLHARGASTQETSKGSGRLPTSARP
jgi:AcrR family transcriptional regulator